MAAALFLLLRAGFRLLEIEVLWEVMSACSQQGGTGAELAMQVAILVSKYLWDLKNTLSASLNFFSESFYYVFTPSRLGKREDVIEEADFMCQASMERSPT